MEELEDNNLAGTEPYPAEHDLVEDAESLAGDDCDDWFLDEDGDGINDAEQDEEDEVTE